MKRFLLWLIIPFSTIILFACNADEPKESEENQDMTEENIETETTDGTIVEIDGKDVTIAKEGIDIEEAQLEDLIIFHFRALDEEIVEQLATGDPVTITHTLAFTRSLPPQGQATKIEKRS